jgi:hypothetical protein
MEIAELVLKFILKFGLGGALIIILILIVQDPDRAVKLQALIFRPLFVLFKWGSKTYIASTVGYQTTAFLKRHVTGILSENRQVKVKVKWVNSPTDPVLKKDGTIIAL